MPPHISKWGPLHIHPVCSLMSRCCSAGWRSVLEALRLAAADPDPAVVNHALDALQPVVEALYSGVGVLLLGSRSAGVRAISSQLGERKHCLRETIPCKVVLRDLIRQRHVPWIELSLAGKSISEFP